MGKLFFNDARTLCSRGHVSLPQNRGGVRGIVELAILKAIEGEIGIPLQRFFDLVVGTR